MFFVALLLLAFAMSPQKLSSRISAAAMVSRGAVWNPDDQNAIRSVRRTLRGCQPTQNEVSTQGRNGNGSKNRSDASLAVYCFVAVKWLLVPCNLSSTATARDLPSAETVMRATMITLPSRLSVSCKVFLFTFFTDTLVVPGSPLYGASVPSSFAV